MAGEELGGQRTQGFATKESMSEEVKSSRSLVTLRTSALPLAFRCPAAIRRGEILINASHEAADAGTATHEVLRTLPTTNKIEWDSIPEIAHTYGADVDETRMLSAMGVKLWNHVSASFRGAMTEVPMSIEVAPGVTLTGHADLLALSQTSRRVGDWKTGRKDRDHMHQFKGYAAMAMKAGDGVNEVTTTGLWIRDQEIENYTMNRSEVDRWIDSLVETVINWDGVYHPGTHCAHCPRSHECEAVNAMVRRDMAAVADKSITARLECEIESMSAEEIISAFHKIELVLAYAKRARDAIKSHAEKHGDIASGKVRLTVVQETKRELDPLAAWPILEELGFKDADLARVIKLRISEIEEVIRERTPKGDKSKAVKQLGELFDPKGAVIKTTT